MSTTTIIGIVTGIMTVCQLVLQMLGVVDPHTIATTIPLTLAGGAAFLGKASQDQSK